MRSWPMVAPLMEKMQPRSPPLPMTRGCVAATAAAAGVRPHRPLAGQRPRLDIQRIPALRHRQRRHRSRCAAVPAPSASGRGDAGIEGEWMVAPLRPPRARPD